MNNKVFVIAALVFTILGFFALRMISSSAPRPAINLQEVAGSFVRPHSLSYGNTMSRVTVVEWFDPECESCRELHPSFKKIIEDYKDRVRFVLRYMPFHPGSMYAASVLEEARELGKFDKALDILFEKQPEWGNHHQPRPDLIPGYLSHLGIPAEKLEREYVIKKHGEKIRLDQVDGQAVGVNGTPTFFVNQRPLTELGDMPLRQAIELELDAP